MSLRSLDFINPVKPVVLLIKIRESSNLHIIHVAARLQAQLCKFRIKGAKINQSEINLIKYNTKLLYN
jgi:hypothetical protein